VENGCFSGKHKYQQWLFNGSATFAACCHYAVKVDQRNAGREGGTRPFACLNRRQNQNCTLCLKTASRAWLAPTNSLGQRNTHSVQMSSEQRYQQNTLLAFFSHSTWPYPTQSDLTYIPCPFLTRFETILDRSIYRRNHMNKDTLASLDRKSIASQCMDIHRSMNIHLWIFIFYGYPLRNVLARISVLGYQCGYPRLYG